MALSIGIVGLPNAGKSTLFNALTKNDVLAANYPFATIEPNVGVVGVPDPRLDELAKIFGSEKTVPAPVTFVDIAGIVKGASEGAGLGNKFLANIRECDAICQVVRVFADDDVVHVDGRVDPRSDIEVIETELILADMQTLEKAGGKVAYRGSVTAGEKDFSALITSLKDKNIDAVYYGGYHPELGLIVRQAQEQGLKPQFIAGDGLNNQEYWSITGPAGEGTLYTDSASAASDPKAQELIASFKKAGLPEPGNFAFYSYAAVQVIAEGLQKSGGTDSGKLAKALHANSFDTVVGPVEFDKKGDITKPNYVMYVWSNGQPKMIAQK